MDIYDLILSEEIREYLRANHRLSIDEKILIIHSAYISLEEKYAALQALLGETKKRKDRDVISQICRLYDWVFEQMYSEMPGQVFLYALPFNYNRGATIPNYHVAGVFHTYKELMDFVENETSRTIDTVTFPRKIDDPDDPDELEEINRIYKVGNLTIYKSPIKVEEVEHICEAFRVEKWAYIDGKMESVVLFDAFEIRGHCCFREFLVKCGAYDKFEEFAAQMGISKRAFKLFNCDTGKNTLPLPFKTGDLVCLDLQGWLLPLYGVIKKGVIITRTPSGVKKYKYVNMYYMYRYSSGSGDSCLEYIRLAGWNIDYTLNLPVIQWLRHADPSELPEGEKRLAELSSGMHRLMKCDRKAAKKMLIPEGTPYIQDVIDEINSILNEKKL